MSRELVNPIRDLFDAAVRHETIKVSCLQCYYAKRKRTPATLELGRENHTRQLQMPDIHEWKRQLRRRR